MSEEDPRKVDPKYPSGGGALGVGHDAAIGTLGAAASFVMPLTGPVVQALLKKCVQAPLEVRRAAWFNLIGEGLRELQDRFEGFDPDRLAENEEFVSTVAETSRIAMATHRAEKLEALRNVVLNVAAGVHLDDVLQGTFLGYVDRFSGLHLKVLKMLSNPAAVPAMVARAENSITGSLSILFEAALPELGSNNPLLARVVADLSQERLTNGATLNGMLSGSGLLEKRTSEFGDSFLKFITSPVD